MAAVTVELSRQAAVFLCAAVRHMNQRKILPSDNRAALETSAWLEEIEAKLQASLSEDSSDPPEPSRRGRRTSS